MKDFVTLIQEIDSGNSTNAKKAALLHYFQVAKPEDSVCTIALFTGRRPKRPVNSAQLRSWAAELMQIPEWLFEESYHIAGDLAETISLLLPEGNFTWGFSLEGTLRWMQSLHDLSPDERKIKIQQAWHQLDRPARFVFNKLITGGFRIGVSGQLLQSALGSFLHRDPSEIAHRLSGLWDPLNISFEALLIGHNPEVERVRPYPFYLAYALDKHPETLGAAQEWQVEWKWDGIRAQLIKRDGVISLWSRGEERINEQFPEIIDMAAQLGEDVVLDAELLVWKEDHPEPFQCLQTRLGRKKPSKNLINTFPVVLMCYDLLEYQGKDLRLFPLNERTKMLQEWIYAANVTTLKYSKPLAINKWEELAMLRENARNYYAEGLMLKRRNSVYKTGRKRGDWWKWKTDPMSLDLVMIYAQRGHGRRANLYTDFTFAVRDEDDGLIILTKAYSGLSDDEFKEVNRFIRANKLERFGPVRRVKPELVFEIAFEGINRSNRNKSGFALRFPRMMRWRHEKTPEQINTLSDVAELWEQTNEPKEWL